MYSGGAAICVKVSCLAVVKFCGGMLRESSCACRKMSLLYALDILMMSCRFCS